MLSQICQHEDADYDVIRNAVTPLMNADGEAELRYHLLSLLGEPKTCSEVAAVISDVCMYVDDTDTITSQLDRLDAGSDQWVLLAEQTLNHCSSQPEMVSWGVALIKKYKEQIRQDARSWSAAALVYDAQGKSKKVIQWFGDWRERDDLKPYMLLSLIEQHRRLEQHDKGHAIALEASAIDEVSDELQTWLALNEFEQANWEQVDRRLKQVNVCSMHPFYQLLYHMMTAVAVSAFSDIDYACSRQTLAELHASIPKDDRFLIRRYYACQRRLARLKNKSLWNIVYHVAGAFA